MNCIVIDDEPLARQGMKNLIALDKRLTFLKSFNYAPDAMDFMKLNTVDLVFLDIQMPGINGMDIAAHLKDKSMVIFTTAYEKYALKGYEMSVVDYLLKPIEEARFYEAIDRAEKIYKSSLVKLNPADPDATAVDYILVKADRKYFKIEMKDILYVEGLKDYVSVYTSAERILTYLTLKGIQQKLPASKFLRVGKSYIVNAAKITSFDNHTVYLGKIEIPLGNVYRKAFFDNYSNEIQTRE